MMDSRIPLSPKKLRSANISPLDCPVSPTKKSRTPSLKHAARTPYNVPLSPRNKRTSPSRTLSHTADLSPSFQTLSHSVSSPVKTPMAPFRVFSDDAVYATHLDAQIAGNSDLVLSPPREASKVSPSPQKRHSPIAASTRQRIGNRPVFGTLGETTRIPRVDLKDSLTLSQNSFLTPPRPRLQQLSQASLADEERITKSASPRLGRVRTSGPLEHSRIQGFTIFVDNSEYVSLVNRECEVGEGVNKENHWLSKNQVHVR